MKKYLLNFFVALLGGFIAYVVMYNLQKTDKANLIYHEYQPQIKPESVNNNFPNLTLAAESSVKSVVHVESVYRVQKRYRTPLHEYLFGNSDSRFRPKTTMSTGSGVIISKNGYIITNNHVVSSAKYINITLHDKRKFKAELIGKDKNTDLALLKIEAENLPNINYGDSESLKLGEWVLAVGNPFNLKSTVTAGIISAKARNIGIMQGQLSIESFLQTDAAVNPGNSGGALVNDRGELIGINTAIESRTGSYSGYSFAIPATIVKKIISDLKEFGQVQRAFLGVEMANIDSKLANHLKLSEIKGVIITKVKRNSSSYDAGLKSGDIILSIAGKEINSTSELQEQISKYRPGENVEIIFIRNSKAQKVNLILKNQLGNTKIIKGGIKEVLGVEFKPLSMREKFTYSVSSGLKIRKIHKGGKFFNAKIEEGFIIYKINNQLINQIEDVENVINASDNGEVFIIGFYPNGQVKHYSFSIFD
ncbi:MAG: Do family serine endopeptidase [Marinifilaceae bacterium]|jgi:Do/DeqQ family serine protease|nr:Do family serine endopeptidase [Marinifilaceae bacterium]